MPCTCMYVLSVCPQLHTHVSPSVSTSLNMHMCVQKSPLTSILILSYLEVHISFGSSSYFVRVRRKGSRESAQGYLSLLCSKKQHISKSHDTVQSRMGLRCSRGKWYNILSPISVQSCARFCWLFYSSGCYCQNGLISLRHLRRQCYISFSGPIYVPNHPY